MGYRNRPFNPLTPTPNQVITELNQANENFDILAQTFLSNNPETFIVKNADKVDGFHASNTPTPNTIPVAGADGKIALGWLPDGVFGGGGGGGYRRINMTDATSDYDLQVGEEAYYELYVNDDNLSFPLRITVHDPAFYQFIAFTRPANVSSSGIRLGLVPNDVFSYDHMTVGYSLHIGGPLCGTPHFCVVHFPWIGGPSGSLAMVVAWITVSQHSHSIIFTNITSLLTYDRPFLDHGGYNLAKNSFVWHSLGTLIVSATSATPLNNYLYVLVRRLI